MYEALWGVAGIVVGWYLYHWAMKKLRRAYKAEVDANSERLIRNVDEAEMRYLSTVRREVTQEILNDDPQAFRRAFDKAHQYEIDLRKAAPDRVTSDFASLCHKYPGFVDFEAMGTRHYVSYADARSWKSTEDLVDLYGDITNFLVINAIRGKKPVLFDDTEVGQLDVALRKRRDRAFEARLKDAVDRFQSYRRAAASPDDPFSRPEEYSDAKFYARTVMPEYSPEIGVGVHFFDTDEYGVHTWFFDDSRDKTYHSWYRSDRSFKEREILDVH
jgi:hypothetical protein